MTVKPLYPALPPAILSDTNTPLLHHKRPHALNHPIAPVGSFQHCLAHSLTHSFNNQCFESLPSAIEPPVHRSPCRSIRWFRTIALCNCARTPQEDRIRHSDASLLGRTASSYIRIPVGDMLQRCCYGHEYLMRIHTTESASAFISNSVSTTLSSLK
eukprot:GHVU01169997.1.p1 GENE.GHVU01169997.1~~GHVU01169997.1.p1  ORF type:complete len:157 (+),score=2.79 GHVU01169997.1:303-773(+)